MAAGGNLRVAPLVGVLLMTMLLLQPGMAQLQPNYYASICPNVESIVRAAVTQKFKETFITLGATIRLIFHDAFVNGLDASVIVVSTANNTAEKDNSINLSLAGDGFDAVIRAKASVDAVPQCTNKVSCADILVMAARDCVALAGGPSYAVELGRLDGLVSTSASVNGNLPPPTFNLDQLLTMFVANGLDLTDLVALSAAHSVGFAHCSTFSSRISPTSQVDPSMNPKYATQLQGACPSNVDPNIVVNLDPVTPRVLDSQYFKNLQQGLGLFSSDQVLYRDNRSQPTVDTFAQSADAFNQAFVTAMTKLGRVGVKTSPSQGNIRRNCAVFN